MADKKSQSGTDLVVRHLEALEILGYAADYFERTANLDAKLVEKDRRDLADELVVIEERVAAVAMSAGPAAAQEGGIGRLLQAHPDIRRDLSGLLGRVLEALGRPGPEDLTSEVSVAHNLHLTGGRGGDLHILRRGRIDVSDN